jgi:acetyl-CoA carboxylase biotin carboxyl carrier protein
MDFDEIQRILAMVKEHELAEFELEHQGFKIRIKKDSAHPPVIAVAAPVAQAPVVPALIPAGGPAAAPETAEESEVEFAIMKSPIVGTFYRAAEPGARPFAEVGDAVKKDQVICIIEAMKLMNEIKSEYDGELVKVYVENGQAVQYGERLFAIRAR